MRISEAASRATVSSRLLRYYEEQGLLSPDRDISGYRDYTEEDLAIIARIRYLLDAGLNTDTIRTTLPCLTGRAGRLAATCPELIEQLRRERDRIAHTVDALVQSQNAIESVISSSLRQVGTEDQVPRLPPGRVSDAS